ncbi:MAG: hypothetical protein JWM09_1112 [Francisellaceae bacterium]|nr:hypothetical protein [Francisellaceae bacterium]
MNDITKAKLHEKDFERLVKYDPLTQVLNRTQFFKRINEIIKETINENLQIALLFINLDHFKKINDNYSREIGDVLLKNVARILKDGIRNQDLVARLSGDEFAILLFDVRNHEEVKVLAERILENIKKPIKIFDEEFHISSSMGIYITKLHQNTYENILKKSHLAMMTSKNLGRNMATFYSNEIELGLNNKKIIENDIHRALYNNEFYLVYQPQIDIKVNKISGFEALIRWMHPKLGLISPMEFIPLAEQSGLIVEIGEWALKTACKQFKSWFDQKLVSDKTTLAVNVSSYQLIHKGFLSMIESIFKTYLQNENIPAQILELEVTESALIMDTRKTIDILNKIRDMGMQIAIDDFGTGYSSLQYLKMLPINKIKIDKSFVDNIETNISNATIIESVVSIAKSLNLKVLAEGVETKSQEEMLIKYGCFIFQGYFYSKPLTGKNLTYWLREKK